MKRQRNLVMNCHAEVLRDLAREEKSRVLEKNLRNKTSRTPRIQFHVWHSQINHDRYKLTQFTLPS
jgi:hypothetical protein